MGCLRKALGAGFSPTFMGISSELLLLGALLLLNGLLVMAELAVVTSSKGRLRALAENGDRRARAALELAESPGRFVPLVQAGVALCTVLASIVAGVSLAGRLTTWLDGFSWLAPDGFAVAWAVIVAGLMLALLVFGELAPRRIALSHPERVARGLAGFLNGLVRIGSPLVTFLIALIDVLLKPFGLKPRAAAPVSDEEVNILVEQGLRAGVFQKAEREMVAGVLELDSLPVTALMTPRPKIVFLNLDDPEEANWRKIVASGHSHFPVFQGTRDQVVGVVAVKALWAQHAIGVQTSLRNLLIPALLVPEALTASQILEQFKKSGKHIALVSDEFGGVQGLVTLIDVMEAIVGDLPTPLQRSQPEARRRDDGSWLVDAAMAVCDIKDLLALGDLPAEDEADYQTLGGFVVTQFGRIPAAGDHFDWGGWRFEVVDMDRHRVDKVLVSKIPPPANVQQAAS